MKNKIILITGGAGFIGSHLCEELAKNNTVYSLDNYFTGSIANHADNVTYINGHTKNINEIIKFKPDLLFHLGEYSRVEQSFDDIEKVWEFNKIGTFAVLEFVRKTGCKLIYAGSSTKFGDGGIGRESSPYAWTKSTNTQLVINYSNWYNIEYAITYFYNVYGGREMKTGKYATLIGLFTHKMKKDRELSVVKPGTQRRNFTHIEDIISALKLIGSSGVGDDYGIASPYSYSILEVAELFGGKINMISERRGNRMTAELITDKTIALGWEPKWKLENYIKDLKLSNNTTRK